MMQDAADGFESRLRPSSVRNPVVRTGVSASGKGVKVGTMGVGTMAGPKKKGKGKGEAEVVCCIFRGGSFLTS